MGKAIDLIGQRFGRLTVVSKAESNPLTDTLNLPKLFYIHYYV